MWPFRRRAAAPLPVLRGEWRTLPPLQRVVQPHPLINPVSGFSSRLASWQNPSFVAPLAHAVGPSEPSGSISDVVSAPSGEWKTVWRAADSVAVPSVEVQRSAEAVAPREPVGNALEAGRPVSEPDQVPAGEATVAEVEAPAVQRSVQSPVRRLGLGEPISPVLQRFEESGVAAPVAGAESPAGGSVAGVGTPAVQRAVDGGPVVPAGDRVPAAEGAAGARATAGLGAPVVQRVAGPAPSGRVAAAGDGGARAVGPSGNAVPLGAELRGDRVPAVQRDVESETSGAAGLVGDDVSAVQRVVGPELAALTPADGPAVVQRTAGPVPSSSVPLVGGGVPASRTESAESVPAAGVREAGSRAWVSPVVDAEPVVQRLEGGGARAVGRGSPVEQVVGAGRGELAPLPGAGPEVGAVQRSADVGPEVVERAPVPGVVMREAVDGGPSGSVPLLGAAEPAVGASSIGEVGLSVGGEPATALAGPLSGGVSVVGASGLHGGGESAASASGTPSGAVSAVDASGLPGGGEWAAGSSDLAGGESAADRSALPIVARSLVGESGFAATSVDQSPTDFVRTTPAGPGAQPTAQRLVGSAPPILQRGTGLTPSREAALSGPEPVVQRTFATPRAVEPPQLMPVAAPRAAEPQKAQSTEPPRPMPVVVARAADPPPPPQPEPEPAPQPAPSQPVTPEAPEAQAVQSAEPSKAQSAEELLRKLYDPLLRRLKADLWLDRERRGALTDL